MEPHVNNPNPEITPTLAVQTELKKGFNFDKHFLPLSILFAAVLISSSILYVNLKGPAAAQQGNIINVGPNKAADDKPVSVSTDDDPVLGKSDAPVTIIEFSDFQCPFCRAFWEDTLPLIKKNYIDTGKVKFVYRDYPLDNHPAAMPSALAAECADDQGKYWEYHDKIFAEQAKKGVNTISYSATDLKKWAAEIKLNTVTFNTCLDAQTHKAEVEKDFQDGVAAGVNGTPGFYVNGIPVRGALPYESFKTLIEAELKKIIN
jgi:protein-disulfide isomerase